LPAVSQATRIIPATRGGEPFGDQELRRSPVVEYQRDVTEVQGLEQLGHEARLSQQRQIRVRAHWAPMPAKRQRR
jgi:hypothetical protein